MFKNAHVFNGSSFKKQTFYIKDSLLSFSTPGKVDTIIDLSDLYVIPPLAEAHIHSFYDKNNIDKEVKTYLKNGIFYVLVQETIWTPGQEVLDKINKKTSVDVVLANAALVTPWYRTINDLYKPLLKENVFGKAKTIEAIDLKHITLIESKNDLLNKWSSILKNNTDVIKVILAFGSEYQSRKHNSDPNIASGINPELLPLLVKKAHDSKRRVSAHIETADDFEIAVTSGVDIIAHFPGWRIGKSSGYADNNTRPWIISDKAAKLAADKGTVVVTTITPKTFLPDFTENKDSLVKIHSKNLKTLVENNVRIAIGSDDRRNLIHEELKNIKKLNVVDNVELLNLVCEKTPQYIFPNRKIGALKEGFEASFLVLKNNPVEDIENLKNIEIAYKQGQIIWNKRTDDSIN